MTVPKSAYPVSVQELLPKARKLAAKLGKIPSQRKLREELHIGAPKAADVLKALQTDPIENTAARLHLVPDATATDPTDTSDAVSETVSQTVTDTVSTGVETTPEPHPAPVQEPAEDPATDPSAGQASQQVPVDAEPPTQPGAGSGVDGRRPVATWPVLLLALPAFVAIWSGWVGLGGLTGFGIVHPLPGIADGFALNTAITLPIGVETYAAYALRVWLSGRVPPRARRFAKHSALGSLALGAAGQVAYHLMTAAGMTEAPWWITTLVACLPVAVLGMGAALTHLLRSDDEEVTTP